MGSWNYSHVGLMFDKSKNDAKLIDQAMKCMGYKETDYLYLDETGLDGPVWSNDCGDMSLNYETPDNSYVEQILNILNTLFCDVSIYYVKALGSNTSDYYSGTEETFDLVTSNRTRKVVGNRSAKSEIEKITLSELIDPELIRQLIDNGSQKGYNELVDLVKTKTEGMQYSIGEIVDGVLRNAFKSIINCVIPDSVTSIGDWAFDGCRSLTNITIPDSVTSIGNYAFYGCSSLTSITIPDSVTSIGNYAFHGCSSLTSITIPDSVTSIGDDAFSGCSSLTSITIPDSVTSIGDNAFHGCSSLTSITIPNSVTSIDWATFNGCSSLTSITIPDSVTSIGDDAFSGCSSLTSISMSNGAPDVSAGAFDDTPWVKNNPDEMIIIGKTLYKYKGRKPNISIPDNITKIGRNVFKGRKGLKSIVLPESVTSIGYSAFGGCTGLTSITIPDSVSSIGDEAFAKCPKCVIVI